METEQVCKINKQELIDELIKHYEHQKQLCEMKWESAIAVEETGAAELNANRKTKKENTDLKEYNSQVDAIGRTITTIIKILKSGLPENEEKQETDDLI